MFKNNHTLDHSAFIKSVIEWDLRESMKSQDVGIVFQMGKERQFDEDGAGKLTSMLCRT